MSLKSDVCLHLLCYMICLTGVTKKAEELLSFEEITDLLKQLAEHTWHTILPSCGARLTSREIKLLPSRGRFDRVSRKLAGLNATVQTYIQNLGNRFAFKTRGILLKRDHVCPVLCTGYLLCSHGTICNLNFLARSCSSTKNKTVQPEQLQYLVKGLS